MTRHEALLREYASELRTAKTRAETWWTELTAQVATPAGGKQRADEILRSRWPDGPASHPFVLAVIRKYWLACEALNEQIEHEEESGNEGVDSDSEYVLAPEEDEDDDDEDEDDAEEDEEVYPHLFVLEWLMTDEFDDLADFLGALSYWPIGLDQDDRYT